MSSLFPIRSEPSPGAQDPRVVDLEGEDAEQVFSALSSETARRIVTVLHEQPRTQSDIADAVDTSVQNVRYHLDKLEGAGLVEVVDTWYSSRGNEMAVYAPADGALIVSGDRGRASRLKNALSRLVGGVAVIGMASLLVQALATRLGRPFSLTGGTGGAGGLDDGPSTVSGGAGGDGGSNTTGEDFAMNTKTSVEATDESVRTVADGATETTAEGTVAQTATGTPEVSATATPAPTPTATSQPTATPKATETTVVTDGGVEGATTTTDVATTTAPQAFDAAYSAGTGLPPGLLFFLGGVSVLLVLVAVWYWSGG